VAYGAGWTVDCFLVFAWEAALGEDPLPVTINYAPNQGLCNVRFPFPDLAGQTVRLKDMLGEVEYKRDGNDLTSRGLYLNLPPWGYHVFTLSTTPTNGAETKANTESESVRRKADKTTTKKPKTQEKT
jgi:hypothetical protein